MRIKDFLSWLPFTQKPKPTQERTKPPEEVWDDATIPLTLAMPLHTALKSKGIFDVATARQKGPIVRIKPNARFPDRETIGKILAAIRELQKEFPTFTLTIVTGRN